MSALLSPDARSIRSFHYNGFSPESQHGKRGVRYPRHFLRAKYNKEVFSWREPPCTSVRASEEVGIETEKQRFLPRRARAIGGTAGTRLDIVNKLLKQPVRFLGGFTVDFLSIDGVQ